MSAGGPKPATWRNNPNRSETNSLSSQAVRNSEGEQIFGAKEIEVQNQSQQASMDEGHYGWWLKSGSPVEVGSLSH